MTPILEEQDSEEPSDEELAAILADLKTRLPQPSAGHWAQAFGLEDVA